MYPKKIGNNTLSFGKFTAMGTANIIGKDKGVLMATGVGVLPMVMALDFATCPGCIQRGYSQCEYASSCPVLAACIVYESHPAPLLLDETLTKLATS